MLRERHWDVSIHGTGHPGLLTGTYPEEKQTAIFLKKDFTFK